MQNPRAPIGNRTHFDPRPTSPVTPPNKLEFAALQHYLVVDRSAHPSEPLRFDGQHLSSQAVGHYRSPAPSPAPGFGYLGKPLSSPARTSPH